ncbi:F0F1 ATP synthase subunit I [Legionella geestiana]|uniref:ATP synthase subunit I n=1 Tax=Legionella geestiana TaxID=45065 RepID=UPI0010923E4E|nr:ATP synthase subunit I [Legionella geestiana]QDQ39954.1 F0F1 ATP synthase subunit I [Legionella geestiana]
MVNNQPYRRGINRLLAAQLGVTVLLTFHALCISGLDAAASAFLGGAVCVAGSVVFARALFRHSGARAARKIVRGFYLGEACKLVLTMALFAVVFASVNVQALLFFVSYIVVQMVLWLAPVFLNKPDRRKSD